MRFISVKLFLTFVFLISPLDAGIVLSVSSLSVADTDASGTLTISIHDTMSPPETINALDLAIAIGDGGSVPAFGGTDPINISNVDFSTGVFSFPGDANTGSPNPAFGDGAVVRGIQSTTGVALTSTPQTLAVVTLTNLVAGSYPIDLNALGLTNITKTGVSTGLNFTRPAPASSIFSVTAVPEPSAFLFLTVGFVFFGARSRLRMLRAIDQQ